MSRSMTPKIGAVKSPDLIDSLSADEIDLILAYRSAAQPYQMTVLASAKRQALANKVACAPSLRLVAGGVQ